jgi:hypothetical protein
MMLVVALFIREMTALKQEYAAGNMNCTHVFDSRGLVISSFQKLINSS